MIGTHSSISFPPLLHTLKNSHFRKDSLFLRLREVWVRNLLLRIFFNFGNTVSNLYRISLNGFYFSINLVYTSIGVCYLRLQCSYFIVSIRSTPYCISQNNVVTLHGGIIFLILKQKYAV